jgi:hypothetical protein
LIVVCVFSVHLFDVWAANIWFIRNLSCRQILWKSFPEHLACRIRLIDWVALWVRLRHLILSLVHPKVRVCPILWCVFPTGLAWDRRLFFFLMPLPQTLGPLPKQVWHDNYLFIFMSSEL